MDNSEPHCKPISGVRRTLSTPEAVKRLVNVLSCCALQEKHLDVMWLFISACMAIFFT